MFVGNLMGVIQTMPLAVYLNRESNFNLDGAVVLSVILVVISPAVSLAVRLVSE